MRVMYRMKKRENKEERNTNKRGSGRTTRHKNGSNVQDEKRRKEKREEN